MAVFKLMILASLAAFVGALVWAAYSDARFYIIPDTSSIVSGAAFVIFALAVAAGYENIEMSFWLGHFVVAIAAFIFGLIVFHTGMMGGGDIKLITAIALWAGPQLVLVFLLTTSLAGGFVALGRMARMRRRAPLPEPDVSGTDVETPLEQKIPYGIAIAAGGLAVAAIWWLRLQ